MIDKMVLYRFFIQGFAATVWTWLSSCLAKKPHVINVFMIFVILLLRLESNAHIGLVLFWLLAPTIFLFTFELEVYNLILHENRKIKIALSGLDLAARTCYIENLIMANLAHLTMASYFFNAYFTEKFRTVVAHFAW